jgi:hypothetical protein
MQPADGDDANGAQQALAAAEGKEIAGT